LNFNFGSPRARLTVRKKGLYVRQIFIGMLLALVAASPAWAQDVSAVELQIERLRAQLREVADREAQLQSRASQLDEDLRPENIERSVAPFGTTDAAALREQRRGQLGRQKASVNEQLASLAASRTRLESAIATAEAEAVRLKAASLAPKTSDPGAAVPATAPAPTATAPAVKRKAPARMSAPRRRNRARRRK